MKEVLDAIDDALKAKGLSRSAVSRLATGNASTLKNLHATEDKDRERRTTLDNIKSITDFLGLEFYVGPPRANELREAPGNFQGKQDDAGWVLLHPSQSDLVGKPQVIDRLHLPESWFKNADLDPQNAALVYLEDDGMYPTLPRAAMLIIDTSDSDVTSIPEIRAYQVGATVRVRRLELSDQWLTARPDNPRHMTETFAKRYHGVMTVLGLARAMISSI